jgi:hypothetical protein
MLPKVITLLLSGLLLASGMIARAAPAPLPDQNDQLLSLADYPNQAVLAIVVSGRKLRHIKKWEEGLRKAYPELTSVRVADITDEPRPSQEQVAEKLRKRAPADVRIMIDMDNLWATEYELDTSEPCLLLFDDNGQVIAQFRGRASKERLNEVMVVLAEIFPPAAADEIS